MDSIIIKSTMCKHELERLKKLIEISLNKKCNDYDKFTLVIMHQEYEGSKMSIWHKSVGYTEKDIKRMNSK